MIPFEKVISGTARYFDRHIYSGMNDWQEIVARLAVGRVMESMDNVKTVLMENGIIKTLCIMDESGNVDVERLCGELKREIQRKDKVVIKIPVFGKYTFSAGDVDELYRMIMEVSA